MSRAIVATILLLLTAHCWALAPSESKDVDAISSVMALALTSRNVAGLVGDSTSGLGVDLAVYPPDPSTRKGGQKQLRVYRSFDGHELTNEALWTSSDPSIASVGNDPGNKGMVTGHGVDPVKVTAQVGTLKTAVLVSVDWLILRDYRTVDAVYGYTQHAALAVNNQNKVLAAYSTQGTCVACYPVLASRFYDGSTSPPVWQTKEVGATNYAGAIPQLVMNSSGKAAMVYPVTQDAYHNRDWNAFGLAYFDGSNWTYTRTIPGVLWVPPDIFMTPQRTPVIGIDSNGIVTVAYQNVDAGIPTNELVVARYDQNGVLGTSIFPEPVGTLLVSVCANDQVMVLNTASGSRKFNGNWSSLAPFPVQHVPPGPVTLKLLSNGSARFVVSQNQILSFNFNGTNWDDGMLLGVGMVDGAAAVSEAGTIVVVFAPSLGDGRFRSRYYNGTSWESEQFVNEVQSQGYGSDPYVLVDGAGRFLMIHSGTVTGYFYSGKWSKSVVSFSPAAYPHFALNDAGSLVSLSFSSPFGHVWMTLHDFAP